MLKNGFLTFCCAFIPGAGQMYQGYMKRGLSLILTACLIGMVSSLLDPVMLLLVVVWMYSFFDTYDLIRHLAAGEPKDDDLLLPANWDNIRAILPQHNKLLGWGLIAFGVWALYDILIADWMTTVLEHFFGYGYAYDIIHGIPNILVGILLVVAGIKLLGLHPAKKADPNEADTLPPHPNEKQ